jgi:hypothetical protein
MEMKRLAVKKVGKVICLTPRHAELVSPSLRLTDCFTTFHFVRNDALILANRHRDPPIGGVAIYLHCRIMPN